MVGGLQLRNGIDIVLRRAGVSGIPFGLEMSREMHSLLHMGIIEIWYGPRFTFG